MMADGGCEREEEREGAGGKSEEEVYTMLYKEVDAEGNGVVSIESLVAYLHQMQLGSGQGDQVFDSHEDVYQIQYNLQLLKAMLEEKSGGSGVVDLETYSHVIRLWVKDVRDRSNQQPPLELSQLSSDSEEGDDGVTPRPQLSFGDQSFETSGGNSSTHSTHDSLEVLATLDDVRQENRRLAEKERQLQTNLDHSEEQLRALQSENSSLLSQLHQVQQQVGRVEVVERKNSAIAQSLREEENKSHRLEEVSEEMREELARAKGELEELKGKVREGEGEIEREEQEVEELQLQLQEREEALGAECLRRQQLQLQLSEMSAAHNSLRSKVMELEEGNGALQRENEELHTATLPPGPAYSTPYRPSGPPSLHDEISRHGNLSDNALSPLVEVDHRHGNSKESFQSDGSFGNLSLEDLEHIARNSSNKFHSKTEVIVRLLSELMPSPPPSSHLPSHSSDSITEVSRSRGASRNMRQLVMCVKKLYSEKKLLKEQVAELQARLEKREEVDAAVQTAPPVATPPPAVVVATQSRCSRLVGGVVRGVAWGLSVSLLLLLLLAVLVWLHQHLTPCCHSNGPLTPGGMVWALFEPRITVSHHGNI